MNRLKVMIAGVGGASLGTEILKSLKITNRYDIFGCDISPTAYGLYAPEFINTWRIDKDSYVDNIVNICLKEKINWLIPGGEQPMQLLSKAEKFLSNNDIRLICNSSEIVQIFSDKKATFETLSNLNVEVPKTVEVKSIEDVKEVGLPCVIKPSTGSGGSASVFFAVEHNEAMGYADFINRSGHTALAQEYINVDEGEYTVGVLSLPDKGVVGSVALKRDLSSKLSVLYQGRGGVISSGYSQGYISKHHEICSQAETIVNKLNSKGPMNIQGRVRAGKLIPFEINPRFSASTYLRALAGFNEIDMMVRHFSTGEDIMSPTIRPGWYMRSFEEQFVAEDNIL